MRNVKARAGRHRGTTFVAAAVIALVGVAVSSAPAQAFVTTGMSKPYRGGYMESYGTVDCQAPEPPGSYVRGGERRVISPWTRVTPSPAYRRKAQRIRAIPALLTWDGSRWVYTWGRWQSFDRRANDTRPVTFDGFTWRIGRPGYYTVMVHYEWIVDGQRAAWAQDMFEANEIVSRGDVAGYDNGPGTPAYCHLRS
jgi:hypothetical protein